MGTAENPFVYQTGIPGLHVEIGVSNAVKSTSPLPIKKFDIYKDGLKSWFKLAVEYVDEFPRKEWERIFTHAQLKRRSVTRA